jgi:hypothetical protein
MQNIKTAIAIVVVCVLGLGTTAFAQDDSTNDNATGALFGPQVGFSKSSDEEATVIFGAALRLKFMPILGIEGSINYHQEDFAGDALTVRSWPVQVTGLLYPVPFLYGAMGAGWYMTTFDYDPDLGFLDDDTTNEFGWHFGGGLELPLGSVAVLAADLRYVFIDYDFEEIPGSDEIDSDFYMATAGFLFRL